MNRDETRKAAQVMLAWAGGRTIEVSNRGRGNWIHVIAPHWDWERCEYRVKTTPVLRSWTEEEVPLGARMRVKGRTAAFLLADTCDEALRHRWLQQYEHSTDGGKTWLPCGVEEVQQ